MRVLEKQATVTASPAEVWQAWTTVEGLKSFFCPDARVDLQVGGAYEPLFLLDQPPGGQGAEGCTVLSFLPECMLSFTWNAPPDFPHLRQNYQCWVVLLFTPTAEGGTTVNLNHMGWGEGEDWDALYAYFDRAWGAVMQSLVENYSVVKA
jgi:uncharacterized protein YndB with AHSA1/START domain